MTGDPQPTPPPCRRWGSLEVIPSLAALASVWHDAWGDQFPPFKRLCLEQAPWTVLTVPCQRNCGCFHSVIPRHDRTAAIGVCCCEPPACPDITLTIDDITPLKINRQKLGRAIARAFQCETRWTKLGPRFTTQIGSWSSNAVPVILTIQYAPSHLRQTVAELVATIRKPFILFAPTAAFTDAKSTQLLQTAGAEFFPLESTVALAANGTLQPLRDPTDLFTRFSSRPATPGTPASPRPRYSIRKDCGVWHLIFDGQEAYIKHERGMFYVAYLLTHPNESFHALDLMAKIPEIYRHQLGLPEITDPSTGKTVILESHARLQERSLALDDAQAIRAMYRKQKELEAILDDASESEPVKAEALRELEEVVAYLNHHAPRSKDAARNAAETLRLSIRRLHARLLASTGTNGKPHPTLKQFAAHIETYILTPRPKWPGPPSALARNAPAGCITYDPTPAITWHP
ncbi:MAG TPA: hypothetical protein VJA21_03550 [Verrucomicrobiae bacterium]